MVERKYLAHFIDAAFDVTYGAPEYVRLGKDLEEYNDELNPDVEVKSNIIGEQVVKVKGYQVQSDVSPYYVESYDDALSEKIVDIANNRTTGDGCKTTVVDVLLKPGADGGAPTSVWAYREDVYVVPNSIGGDTSGVQVPFTVYRSGNRVKGTFDISTKKFTATT